MRNKRKGYLQLKGKRTKHVSLDFKVQIFTELGENVLSTFL